MPILPYGSPGVPNPLPINKGGTGSQTQNFVDLTTTQTVGGAKTFTSNIAVTNAGNAGGTFTNTSAGQFTQTGFTLLNGTSTMTNFGGVAFINLITDAGATQGHFEINRLDYLGAFKATMLDIDMNNNTAGWNMLLMPTQNLTYTLGTSLQYWSQTFSQVLNLNSTASLSGGTASVVNLTGNFGLQTTSSTVGNILVNGSAMLHFYGTGNAFIGTSSGNYTLTTATSRNNFGGGGNTLTALTTGANNAAIGAFAGASLTTGGNNSYVGGSAGQNNQTGNNNIGIGNNALTAGTGANNTAIGQNAGQALVGGATNTFIGGQSGFTNVSGGGGVYLGYKSGYYETASNAFYVNNVDQGTSANDKAFSLLYGTFSGSAGSSTGQQLTINGALNLPLTKKLNITTGTNAIAGTGTLAAGTVTISTTAVTTSSLIFLQDTSNGTNIGTLSVGTKTGGTSFVVNSSNVLDSSTFNYIIIN